MFSKSLFLILALLMVFQVNNTANRPPTTGVAELAVPPDKIAFTMKKLKTKMNKITKQSFKTIGMLTGYQKKRMKTQARKLIGLRNWIRRKVVVEAGVLMLQMQMDGEMMNKLIEVDGVQLVQKIWINQK